MDTRVAETNNRHKDRRNHFPQIFQACNAILYYLNSHFAVGLILISFQAFEQMGSPSLICIDFSLYKRLVAHHLSFLFLIFNVVLLYATYQVRFEKKIRLWRETAGNYC